MDQQSDNFQRQRGNGRASRTFNDQQGDANAVIGDRGGRWQRGGRTGSGNFADQISGPQSFRNRWPGGRQIDPSNVDISGFRDRERAWRQQARTEGWNFNDRDFRTNVFEYRQREAWRDDLLRSVININLGFGSDYYYIPPPQYPAYYGVNYEPWYYNIGYTYYDPYYSGFYVQPYYMAYQPYDYYYSSYYYDDPYYFDDPYDDYVTYRIFASSYSGVGGFVTRLLGGLLAQGYDQGYRDGLLARQAGYDYSASY
jgi:hypothetical protein